MKYYVDTSIWLNLFKKEGDEAKGKPYWKIAKEFIDSIEKSRISEILISAQVLKELKFKLGDKYHEILPFFAKYDSFIKRIETYSNDFDFARKIESENDYNLSFFDCIHIALTKKNEAILITRDRELLKRSSHYVNSDRPENLKFK